MAQLKTTSGINLKDILEIVCQVTNVRKEQILSRNRYKEVAEARHLFCFVSQRVTKLTLEQIGSFLNKTHPSVINSIKRIMNLYDGKNEFYIRRNVDLALAKVELKKKAL